LYEIGPHDLRWDWGRVLAWQPPERLVFSWQIGPDRVPVPDSDSASEVLVTFAEDVPSVTTVNVQHGHWDRHGPDGASYRASFEQVWPYALGRLADLTG
ncbi:MAG: SRPBCC domain-containing protein, partial [Nocardioidaceae bacterium]